MERTNNFKVTVEFNDGTDTSVLYYKSEKVAYSVERSYKKHSFVKSVIVEEC